MGPPSRRQATQAPVLPLPSLPDTCVLPALARERLCHGWEQDTFQPSDSRTTKATPMLQTRAPNAGTTRTFRGSASLKRCPPQAHGCGPPGPLDAPGVDTGPRPSRPLPPRRRRLSLGWEAEPGGSRHRGLETEKPRAERRAVARPGGAEPGPGVAAWSGLGSGPPSGPSPGLVLTWPHSLLLSVRRYPTLPQQIPASV